MKENTKDNNNLSIWAKQFVVERRNSIEYFQKYGNATERALVEKVLELAGAEA